ncbi:mRNA-binding ribosome synthesis protein nop7, partial [Coemansia sp. RSA 2531]
MGKIKKKFSEGSSRTYTTRNRALRKLQVSLADFRRLCILKGIYPVEPRSQKKANRGSSKPTTFYYAKDIQLLLSEPLIAKFREHKIFLRKLQRALGKDDLTRAKGLEARRPEYTLDHLVIERYPAFVDALRDLDDALCMVFLFATMPTVSKVNNEIVEDCKRLSTEFMHYVIHSHSLRKVFLSIKGIYYQAEIQGQSITWIVPYQFSQNVPLDVDFKVMATFLQFYRTLLGFVNYRLYTTSNLSYPPKVDQSMDDSAAGLGSLRVEAKRVEDLIKGVQSSDTTSVPEVAMSKQMKQRMDTLGSKIKKIVAADTTAPAYESVGSGEADGDVDDETRQIGNLLFGKQVFFLSREVPRYSLEFVVRAFGGRLGWDQTSGGGSPYAENDRAITVQISDRPVQGHQFLDRIYVQPQWVYDSINARRLLDVEDYLIGQPLPAHLSPFVEYEEGDYVPEAATKLAAAAGFEGE